MKKSHLEFSEWLRRIVSERMPIKMMEVGERFSLGESCHYAGVKPLMNDGFFFDKPGGLVATCGMVFICPDIWHMIESQPNGDQAALEKYCYFWLRVLGYDPNISRNIVKHATAVFALRSVAWTNYAIAMLKDGVDYKAKIDLLDMLLSSVTPRGAGGRRMMAERISKALHLVGLEIPGGLSSSNVLSVLMGAHNAIRHEGGLKIPIWVAGARHFDDIYFSWKDEQSTLSEEWTVTRNDKKPIEEGFDTIPFLLKFNTWPDKMKTETTQEGGLKVTVWRT